MKQHLKTKARLSTVLFFLVFLLGSLKSSAQDIYEVRRIEAGKDGETIEMKDEKGYRYTTVISLVNGNYIELSVGDKISLEIIEMLEMDPPLIISKNIQVLDRKEDNGEFEYEKEERLTLCINKKKTKGYGIDGERMKCYEVKYANDFSSDLEWETLCEEIAGFRFKKGNRYVIKVKRKWIKDHEFLADRSSYVLVLDEIIEVK